jgi:hypothetical protein
MANFKRDIFDFDHAVLAGPCFLLLQFGNSRKVKETKYSEEIKDDVPIKLGAIGKGHTQRRCQNSSIAQTSTYSVWRGMHLPGRTDSIHNRSWHWGLGVVQY